MKAIGIVGYKGSGKTTLAVGLSRELQNRGHTVVMIKHSDSELLPGHVDSTKMVSACGQAAVIGPSETVISFKGAISLEHVLKYFQADMAIIEGFKGERTYPRIVCLRDETEAQSLFDGLQIGVVGRGEGLAVPLLGTVAEAADLVLEKAFKLPGLDCGACGFAVCQELARAIIAGTRTTVDCASLHSRAVVRVDDEIIPLNPFTSEMVASTIKGLLASLKGMHRGTIRIEMTEK